MKIKRTDLIRFYDERTDTGGRGSDVSAITALWGEDLLLGLLQHYWRKHENAASEIVSYTCTTGSPKGPRLDAWMLKTPQLAEAELYQIEVKNWAAYSYGGQPLAHDFAPDAEALIARREYHWRAYFGGPILPKEIAKVIVPMRPPAEYAHHPRRALLCFWLYVSDAQNQPLSQWVGGEGHSLSIFSASLYLRSLTDESLDLNMPRAERRLGLLSSLQA